MPIPRGRRALVIHTSLAAALAAAIGAAIVESLRAHDIAGATVYRGIGGYGANGRFRKAKAMSLSSDLPIQVSVVDDEARSGRASPCSSR